MHRYAAHVEGVRAQRHSAEPALRPLERRWLDAIHPRLRGDCDPCLTCQQDRDAEIPRLGPLACGHGGRRICHARPCAFLACRFHLGLDVTPAGTIRLLYDDIEDMPETCALDVADRGPQSLETIGVLLGVSRERVRQLEEIIRRRLVGSHRPTITTWETYYDRG
jgi:hypothetical protein